MTLNRTFAAEYPNIEMFHVRDPLPKKHRTKQSYPLIAVGTTKSCPKQGTQKPTP